jgi:hypothetical protein
MTLGPPRRICHRKKKKTTDLQRRQRNGTDLKKEQRKKQLKSTTYVVFLFDFAGHRCRREEKEKTGQIRPSPALEHAPPAFLHEFLQFLKHFLCNSWSFEDYFVKFELFDVIFIYFWIL